MSKKSRLFIILAVLAVCFAFLWPSISWYARTPEETQKLALGSLEKIKDYSSAKAAQDVKELKALVAENPNAALTKDQKWLAAAAKKNYKELKEKVPSPLTLTGALDSFTSEAQIREVAEGRYRKAILKAKDQYKNSVKLGLDLSGGMNVIVKADMDYVIEHASESEKLDVEALKAKAMEQTIETLTGRIDRFGLSEPVIRQQGDDGIYIELPGAAETDQISSIIMGRGILNFRLVDTVPAEAHDVKMDYVITPSTTIINNDCNKRH